MKKIEIGESASVEVVATEELVKSIAEVSGDNNPVHLDKEFAEKTIFKKQIAHGLLCVNGISKILGTMLPGVGTILLSQSFKYKAPVYIGDTVTIMVSVKEIKSEKNIYILETICSNQNEQIVMEGESVVKWESIER
ncbi:MaoC family dehydratase [Roseburia inulinivorans]|uniref:(R)-specific enoyl-CoA hydratase n=1 Tax=Roseburia inulinivorans TaxID=360807 RepID=A0A173XLC6_9FIRM|nr:MaoC family dehydratase [Roseburia inulinivorans]CUN52463.1 (R)-specific enoyl-CoA hydratase [Roseburia inulinivorans]